MEIKKYVLLDELCNNSITKIDNLKGIDFEEKGFTVYDEFEKERLYSQYVWVRKTSDNILDLVEVGDLVSFRSVSGVYYVIGIDDENIYVFDNAIEKEEVKNIYKLQPNGDYKKYKVEE